MNTQTKGLPLAVVQSGNYVHIWCSSPDGDSSDSQILEIRCADTAQASQVRQAWLEMTGLELSI